MLLQSRWTPRLADIKAGPVERLVVALADDILEGRLTGGDRLHAHRELSWALGIGVGTVTKAYTILERRGLVRSVKGSGTFVAVRQAVGGPLIDLSANVPPGMLGRRLFAKTLADIARKIDADHFNLYAPPAGHIRHRRLLSRWLETLGLIVDPLSLVLTSGAQQALALALDLACGQGGIIITERMTYPGVIALSRHKGYGLCGVEMDDEGMMPSALVYALDSIAQGRRRVVYLTPTLHNPTTATMGIDRRRAIIDICRAKDVLIIEDGVYVFSADALPHLATLAPERCLHVGSLSKTLSPGLRIGVLTLPHGMEAQAEAILAALPLSPSPLSCAVVEDWLANGMVESVRSGLYREAERRSAMATAILKNREICRHPGGYHLWLPMTHTSADQFHTAATALGVAVTPPEAVMAEPNDEASGIRLCLGGPSPDELSRALTVLAGIGTTRARAPIM